MAKKENFIHILGQKIRVSVISFFGLPIFMLYWIGFQWTHFSIFQNIIILLISVLVFLMINGVNWTKWSRD